MLSNYIFMAGMTAKRYLRKFLKNEKGDTNFISIMIVLGIAIGVAGIFIGFKDQIVGKVSEIVNGFQFG